MIQKLRFISLFVLAFLLFNKGCIQTGETDWTRVLPEQTQLIFFPDTDTSLADVLLDDFIPLFDDLSPAIISEMVVLSQYSTDLKVHAVSVFPDNADTWYPVWITLTSNSFLERAAQVFSKPFTELSYRFNGHVIYRLFTPNSIIYGVTLGSHTLISQSSYAIEEAIRSYIGDTNHLVIHSMESLSNKIFINSRYLHRLINMQAAVRFRPRLQAVFSGTTGGLLTPHTINQTMEFGTWKQQFSGTIGLDYAERSPIIHAVSTLNHTLLLDRYVSSDAAVFTSFQHLVQSGSLDVAGGDGALDQFLNANTDDLAGFIQSLNPAFGFAAFAGTGSLSAGDQVYIRLLDDVQTFNAFIRKLKNEALIVQEDNLYYIQSKTLGGVLSSNMMDDEYFYIGVSGSAVYISPRTTLVRRSISDRTRRRVLYFDETFTAIRKTMPDQLSSLVYINSPEAQKYLSSLTSPLSNLGVLMNQFDVAVIGTSVHHDSGELDIQINTFQLKQSSLPYAERWVLPLDGTPITGVPTISAMSNRTRTELLVATEGGSVFAFAADGTQIFRADTGTDLPIGSPFVYDWYANNQMTVMIAAGNKIYGWNNRGIPLPNFPIVMEEMISAPIQIGDVTRNGLPELIVATADRKLHVLDRRGQNIPGWPQSVNTAIRNQPVFATLMGRRSIISYAENILFAWDSEGTLFESYPVFLEAPVRGELMIQNDHVLFGAANGFVYAVGPTGYFPEGSAVLILTDSLAVPQIRAISVSNMPVVINPEIRSYSTRNADGISSTERMMLVLSGSGTMSLYNLRGELRFSENMGQSSEELHTPLHVDLNGNRRAEILGLGSFGRLFAWDPLTSERFTAIPATSMRYPVLKDIFGDGRIELIGYTREGLRCWSINPG